jgi:transcriptional regulator with XRE-family HTH domain
MPPKKAAQPIPIGKRIKRFRTKQKITYDQLANDTGFAIDYLKAVESGKKTPPVGALLQIARALKIDSGSLLREDASKLKKRIKAYTKRTDNYAYETLTPGAENKHLKAFRITVNAMQEHKGVGYQHEGEEFVYILTGKMEITVGEHVNLLKAGESLHFNSGIPHHMKNAGVDSAELLVVLYGP